MFKNVNQDNIDSIITQIHMDNSKIYLRYEQTGEIIEPETLKIIEQYQQQHQ